MSYSTLLTLVLTTPSAKDLLPQLLPLVPCLLPHLEQLLRLVQTFREQPLTPAATRDFELQLQQALRQLGLDLCDWTFNHLEPDDPQQMPQRLEAHGERYRRRQRSTQHPRYVLRTRDLHRYLYEDLEPGNPCLFPLEKRLGVVAGAATPALAERAPGGWPNGLRRQHWRCWPAITASSGPPRPCVASRRPSPPAWKNSARRPRSNRCWPGWTKPRAAAGRHRPVLVAGRDGIHLPIRASAYKEGATATLTVFDRRGRRLGTVYLGQMPQAGQGTLSQQMTDLIEAVLRRWQGPLPRLGYVTDGGHHPVATTGKRWRRDASSPDPGASGMATGGRLLPCVRVRGPTGGSVVRRYQGRPPLGAADAPPSEAEGRLKRVLQAATYYAGERKLKGAVVATTARRTVTCVATASG